MNTNNDYLKPEDIRALANSFQQSRILLSAIELGLFTVLDKHMLHSKDVAQKINADERATDRLMNALVALGFLRKVHGKFYNSENASQYLVKGKPEFMGGLFHSIGLWTTWSSLTESVIAGTSAAERKPSPGGIDWQRNNSSENARRLQKCGKRNVDDGCTAARSNETCGCGKRS